MRTMEQLMNDNRAEWLEAACKWQRSQADAFRRMQRAQERGDEEFFHDAAFDHADCYKNVQTCMEYAAAGEPVRQMSLEMQMEREQHPEAGW